MTDLPLLDPNKPEQEQGLCARYHVNRVDGSSEPGGKHEKCRYFVLDLDHDHHAWKALIAYASSCQEEFPELAKDIDKMVQSKICGTW